MRTTPTAKRVGVPKEKAAPLRAPMKARALPAANPAPRPKARQLPCKHAALVSALQPGDDEDSPFALRPSNPADLNDLMRDVDDAINEGVNANTSRGEVSAWSKYYTPYCRMLRTALWRGVEAVKFPLREGAFAAGFAQYVHRRMKARRRTDTAPRVKSVSNVLAHVRRKHERRGMLFSDNKMIAHLLRGLMRRRLAAHGVALPVRAEPFTVRENLAMLDLHEGERLGRRVYAAASRYWRGWRCVNTYADQAGPRKQEIVGEPDMGFTRDDVQFHINGELHADPDPEVLRSMVNRRDRVTVRVGPSKADQDGTIFGPNLVVSLFNDTNPMAFANAIVDYELAFPCRGKQRAKTWLFTPDGSSRWSESAIDGTLRDIMAAKLTAAQRRQKTFHSKRVWVATGLKGLPEPSSDGEVQALVRWSSLESLRIYARMNHAYQARRRDELIHAEVDAVNATACPQIDDTPEDNARLAAEDGLLADAVDLDVAA